MSSASQYLALQGVIVLSFGMLLGAPYASAIKRDAPERIVNAWRLAHFSLPVGGTLMLAIAMMLPSMKVSTGVVWLIAVSLIVASCGFCVSTPLAAMLGRRGLGRRRSGLGRFVYLGNIVGAVSSLIGAFGLLYATFVSF